MGRDIGLCRKIFDGDCNFNLTSICCVYKEKIVTDDSIPKNELSVHQIRKLQFDKDRKITTEYTKVGFIFIGPNFLSRA